MPIYRQPSPRHNAHPNISNLFSFPFQNDSSQFFSLPVYRPLRPCRSLLPSPSPISSRPPPQISSYPPSPKKHPHHLPPHHPTLSSPNILPSSHLPGPPSPTIHSPPPSTSPLPPAYPPPSRPRPQNVCPSIAAPRNSDQSLNSQETFTNKCSLWQWGFGPRCCCRYGDTGHESSK